VTPVRELADRVKGVYREIHDRAGNTMHDFEATDFVALAEAAGFAEVHADARYDVAPSSRSETWDVYENRSANPLVPTLREAADSVLTPEESERFRSHLRTQVESGEGVERSAFLYLFARK
jgi:hypothetical protein